MKGIIDSTIFLVILMVVLIVVMVAISFYVKKTSGGIGDFLFSRF